MDDTKFISHTHTRARMLKITIFIMRQISLHAVVRRDGTERRFLSKSQRVWRFITHEWPEFQWHWYGDDWEVSTSPKHQIKLLLSLYKSVKIVNRRDRVGNNDFQCILYHNHVKSGTSSVTICTWTHTNINNWWEILVFAFTRL